MRRSEIYWADLGTATGCHSQQAADPLSAVRAWATGRALDGADGAHRPQHTRRIEMWPAHDTYLKRSGAGHVLVIESVVART